MSNWRYKRLNWHS